MSKDMAELTSRLAITAIEQNELYQAAKRDAEEAEAYAASLESDMTALTDMLQKSRAANVALEAKLEVVTEAHKFELVERMKHKAPAEKAEAALAVAGQNAASIARSFGCCHVPEEIAAEILAQIEERGE